MAYAGTYAPASLGETRTYSVDFSGQIPSGDSILSAASVSTALSVLYGTDVGAASRLIGSPTTSGSVVSQNIGGQSPNGLQPGVTYLWTVTAGTVQGRRFVNTVVIPCVSQAYMNWQVRLANEMGIPSYIDPNFQTNLFAIVDEAEQRCYRELDLLYATSRQTVRCVAGNRNLSLGSLPQKIIILEAVNVITAATTGPDFNSDFNTDFLVASVAKEDPETGKRNQLRPTSREYLDAVWNSNTGSSVPLDFAMIDNQNIIFGPWPDKAYTVEVIGKYRPNPIYMSTGDTFLTTYLPDMFFAAAMVAACGYLKTYGAGSDDPRMALSWEQQYQALKTSALSEETRKKFRGFENSAQSTPSPAAA